MNAPLAERAPPSKFFTVGGSQLDVTCVTPHFRRRGLVLASFRQPVGDEGRTLRSETASWLPRRAERGLIIADRRRGYDRRRVTLRTFVQGGLKPRRRGGRRAEDAFLQVDWHEPHLLVVSTTILLLSVADALLTLLLLSHGAYEANPVMAYVLRDHPEAFAAVKMALTGSGVLVLVAASRAKVLRLILVSSIIHAFLLAYVALSCYVSWLLNSLV